MRFHTAWVVLDPSWLRSVLVKSDANDLSDRMQTGGQVECNFATPPDWLLSCTLLTDSVENSLPWFVLQKSARLRLKPSLLAAVSQAQISRSSLQK